MKKTNLELKHYCSDFVGVRKVLRAMGAKKEVVKKQEDYFFELPEKTSGISPRLKLRLEGNVKSLIYYERPDFGKTDETTSRITLYDVRDNELLPFLKQALGIKAIVNKTREVWRKSDTVFHLDTIKGIGSIFEIELQKTGKITHADRTRFTLYRDRLLPYLGEMIKSSNVDLVRVASK